MWKLIEILNAIRSNYQDIIDKVKGLFGMKGKREGSRREVVESPSPSIQT